MKKLSKKLIIAIISVLALSLLSGFTYFDHKHKQDEKYKQALKQYIAGTQAVQMASDIILSDYSSSWRYGIWSDRTGVTMEGEIRKAIKDNQELANSTEKIYDKTEKNLKVISEASQSNPDDYKEIYEESKKLYSTMSALMDQVESPTGSLVTFNQNVNSLNQDFESSHSLLETLSSNK